MNGVAPKIIIIKKEEQEGGSAEMYHEVLV